MGLVSFLWGVAETGSNRETHLFDRCDSATHCSHLLPWRWKHTHTFKLVKTISEDESMQHRIGLKSGISFIEPLIKYTLGWPLHNKIHQIISNIGAEIIRTQDPRTHNMYHPWLWVNALSFLHIWTSEKQSSDLSFELWIKNLQIQDKHLQPEQFIFSQLIYWATRCLNAHTSVEFVIHSESEMLERPEKPTPGCRSAWSIQ